MSARLAWISFCAVKGLALQQLDECELTEAGVAGDREFFLVDEEHRLVNSKGLGALQQIVPRYDAAASVAKEAQSTGKTLRQVVLERKLMDAATLDRVLDPANMSGV